MQHARDTFLHYVADNLPGITVHNVRFDKSRPTHNEQRQNAINIEFLTDRMGVSTQSLLQASIDVVFDDERSAIAAVKSLWSLLGRTEIIPLKSYDVLGSPPTLIGTMLRWSSKAVKFTALVSDLTFNYNCHLVLYYSDPTLLA